MDKFVLKVYPRRFWEVAEVFKNDVKIASINRFYDVTPEWITIYETTGGSGIGFKKGDVISKIFIGNAEFEKQHAYDD